jgi:hypothetical protein
MIAVLAWLLAIALGTSIFVAVCGIPRCRTEWMATMGYAVPVGLVACALTIRLPSAVGYESLPASIWAWPAATLVLVLGLWWRVGRRMPVAVPGLGFARTSGTATPASHHLWIGLIVTLIAVRAFWLFDEAWLRPLFGWDAWLAWSAKAKAWLLSGRATPFVDGPTWLTDAAGATRTSLAHHYPELLSWLQVWLSSAAGDWSEPAVNIAWPMLWLALVAGSYGQWRSLGVAPLTAAIGAYLLASIPLANVHAALPGYADLWVATLFVFAVLSLLRWRERGERGQFWIALGLAAILPSLKLEGMVWTTAVLALMLWYSLSGQGRLVRFLAAGACVVVLVAVSWLLDLPWIGLLFELLTGTHPGGGKVFDVLTSTASGLFTQDNWHLLWYLLPAVVVWRWAALRASPALTGTALLLLAGLSLLFVLFLGTSAGRWAESFTAVNRLVLHLAPIAISLMVLVLRESPGRDEVRRLSGSTAALDTGR